MKAIETCECAGPVTADGSGVRCLRCGHDIHPLTAEERKRRTRRIENRRKLFLEVDLPSHLQSEEVRRIVAHKPKGASRAEIIRHVANYHERKSYRQIAEFLGVSERTVRRHAPEDVKGDVA